MPKVVKLSQVFFNAAYYLLAPGEDPIQANREVENNPPEKYPATQGCCVALEQSAVDLVGEGFYTEAACDFTNKAQDLMAWLANKTGAYALDGFWWPEPTEEAQAERVMFLYFIGHYCLDCEQQGLPYMPKQKP